MSQASHVSASLGPLQTLVLLSCGRWPSWILCRMRRRRDSWSIVASQVAAAREHTPHSPGSRRLGSANPGGRGAGGGSLAPIGSVRKGAHRIHLVHISTVIHKARIAPCDAVSRL